MWHHVIRGLSGNPPDPSMFLPKFWIKCSYVFSYEHKLLIYTISVFLYIYNLFTHRSWLILMASMPMHNKCCHYRKNRTHTYTYTYTLIMRTSWPWRIPQWPWQEIHRTINGRPLKAAALMYQCIIRYIYSHYYEKPIAIAHGQALSWNIIASLGNS